jgi:hypothetical protein
MHLLNTYYVNESDVDDNHDFQYSRRLYIDKCIINNGIHQYIKIHTDSDDFINRYQLFEHTDEIIKDIFYYNDEYNHQRYITIITKLNYIENEEPVVTIAYFSDEYGNRNTNNTIICNYGNYLLSTHYSSIFDVNFQAYNILNDIYNSSDNDFDELEIDINQIIQSNIDKINNLPIIQSDSISINTDICSICMDESNKDMISIKTNCNHVFHKECLTSWITANFKNDSCPYCRNKL